MFLARRPFFVAVPEGRLTVPGRICPVTRRHAMQDYTLMIERGWDRYEDLLREAERTRRALRSKQVNELPRTLRALVLFLISVT
jgi:hypothetical protein